MTDLVIGRCRKHGRGLGACSCGRGGPPVADRDRETLEQFLRGEIPKPFEAFYFTKAIRSLLERLEAAEIQVATLKAADHDEIERLLKIIEEGDTLARQEVERLREENERLRASVEGWKEEAMRSHQNVAWRDDRIEAALALLAEAKDTTEQRWRIIEALKGEGE